MRIDQLNRNFRLDRPVLIAHDSVPNIMAMLLAEVRELEQAETTQDQLSELADVIIFSITLMQILGADADEVVRLKIVRNYLKYPAYVLQGGIYTQVAPVLKARWEASGGDELFYEQANGVR